MAIQNGALGIQHRVSPALRVRVPAHVVYRAFVAETVVLNLETGQYHGLNPTAARILETLEASDSIAVAIASLAEHYGLSQDEIGPDVLDLCGALADRGLVILEPSR